MLKAALAGCGVDLAFVHEVPEPTGQAIILLQPGGENSIVIVGGANVSWSAPTSEALEKARRGLSLHPAELRASARYVHVIQVILSSCASIFFGLTKLRWRTACVASALSCRSRAAGCSSCRGRCRSL